MHLKLSTQSLVSHDIKISLMSSNNPRTTVTLTFDLPAPLQDWVVSARRRRRLLMDTYDDGTGEIANPIICLELEEIIVFRIWVDDTDRSLSHYPKYIKVQILGIIQFSDYFTMRLKLPLFPEFLGFRTIFSTPTQLLTMETSLSWSIMCWKPTSPTTHLHIPSLKRERMSLLMLKTTTGILFSFHILHFPETIITLGVTFI